MSFFGFWPHLTQRTLCFGQIFKEGCSIPLSPKVGSFSLQQWFSVGCTFTSQRTLGNFWLSNVQTFWLSDRQGCYWYVVNRCQGCCWTFCDVRDSPPWQRILLCKMSLHSVLSSVLRQGQIFKKDIFKEASFISLTLTNFIFISFLPNWIICWAILLITL